MKDQKIAKLTFDILKDKYKNKPPTGLKCWDEDWQFLFCVILSARSNDDQVNKFTKNLFKKFPTLKSFANADIEEIVKEINSIGFYNSKAKYLKESAKMILDKFDGQVPNSLENLTKLPGVGRKTANVWQGVILGESEGIAVDTHVGRMAQRLKLTTHQKADKIEEDLMNLYDKDEYHKINPILFWHGREVCKARKPECEKCDLNHFCPSSRV